MSEPLGRRSSIDRAIIDQVGDGAGLVHRRIVEGIQSRIHRVVENAVVQIIDGVMDHAPGVAAVVSNPARIMDQQVVVEGRAHVKLPGGIRRCNPVPVGKIGVTRCAL